MGTNKTDLCVDHLLFEGQFNMIFDTQRQKHLPLISVKTWKQGNKRKESRHDMLGIKITCLTAKGRESYQEVLDAPDRISSGSEGWLWGVRSWALVERSKSSWEQWFPTAITCALKRKTLLERGIKHIVESLCEIPSIAGLTL
ncbi:hypothetical protein CAPTEDRAFT_196924 [Capitella teleta]|uniref:Uncharacterized protein n=1 Tax=Capitella teleta TaxID=283909 RepID=R7UQM3_CAPTE|nr:hypothetical protein CAPTEDRAFT_196924 [Capitella teleta]|eukprot:ELU06232.1 hypothetical protein CAPTEDRAFT_196924 [Capitella teleta]